MAEPEELDELLRAMASRHRRLILSEVWRQDRSAGELAEVLGLAPASVSEHLKILRKFGLVTMRVVGTFRFYRAVPERVHELAGLLIRTFPATEPIHDDEESQEAAK